MLLRLGDTILTRGQPLFSSSSKISGAGQPASNAWRGGLRDCDVGKGQLLEKRPVEQSAGGGGIREGAGVEAGVDKGGGEAKHRCRRQRQQWSPPAKMALVEEDLELLEAVEGRT